MEEYLTATSAARYCNVNEKTIYRWVKRGKLTAKETVIDGLRQWQIKVSDLDLFLSQRISTTTSPDTTSTTISQRLQELEARVTELERQLHNAQQQPARITPQRDIEHVAPQTGINPWLEQEVGIEKSEMRGVSQHELPLGTLHIHDFLVRHNLKAYRRRVVSYLDTPGNNLHHHVYPKPNRPDESDRYLTPVQQDDLLVWLGRHHPEICD